ncbi:hypothetical protein EDC01DRAFT_390261 [Geopyxis carbonaria]|nr:hypothetical protein EDC01DRAFT_390261 [Geopyxis carbonaria]
MSRPASAQSLRRAGSSTSSSSLPLRPTSSTMPLQSFLDNRSRGRQPWPQQQPQQSMPSPASSEPGRMKPPGHLFDATSDSFSLSDSGSGAALGIGAGNGGGGANVVNLESYKLPIPIVPGPGPRASSALGIGTKNEPDHQHREPDYQQREPNYHHHEDPEPFYKQEDIEDQEGEEDLQGGYDNNSEQAYDEEDEYVDAGDNAGIWEDSSSFSGGDFVDQYQQQQQQQQQQGRGWPLGNKQQHQPQQREPIARPYTAPRFGGGGGGGGGVVLPTRRIHTSGQQQQQQQHQHHPQSRVQFDVPPPPSQMPQPRQHYDDPDRTIRPTESSEPPAAPKPQPPPPQGPPSPGSDDLPAEPLLTDDQLRAHSTYDSLLASLANSHAATRIATPENLENELKKFIEYDYEQSNTNRPARFFEELNDTDYEAAGAVIAAKKKELQERMAENRKKRRRVVETSREGAREAAEARVRKLEGLKDARARLRGRLDDVLAENGWDAIISLVKGSGKS